MKFALGVGLNTLHMIKQLLLLVQLLNVCLHRAVLKGTIQRENISVTA